MAINTRGMQGAEARRPRLAATMGDPGGIGPEVIAKALASDLVRRLASWLVLGPEAALAAAAVAAGIEPFWRRVEPEAAATELKEAAAGEVLLLDYPIVGGLAREATAEGGAISFRLVDDAIAMALGRSSPGTRVDGIVTGPISKEAWRLGGVSEFPGHTELLADRCSSRRCGMMFVSPRLRVILATAHVPVAAVSGLLSVERVLRAIELGHEACVGLGVVSPRIAVCGLNPHAGEAGLLGTEDAEVISPAIGAAREGGIEALGPFPGDTIFNAAVRGEFDLVVAMYHDQGLIPVKLLDRDRAVNVTVGLPIVRTSPDHGTAFDIAGQNQADPGSMAAAMRLAAEMAERRMTPG